MKDLTYITFFLMKQSPPNKDEVIQGELTGYRSPNLTSAVQKCLV